MLRQLRPAGSLVFDMAPIQAACKASGVDFDQVVEGGERIVEVFTATWHKAHLQHGGKPDPVLEDFIEEARLESKHGKSFVYPPGCS